ncbi:CaiB/BaiF CoA transferase family protein [Actinomadura syzygii]|uniref:CoA transferase n=1 Tax=Actinomadura syzygii TaxID=1427538 RepID=A0A5D0U6C4_9ACTN|nr:CoA transferase [Actinomadura syzygii]TYC13172.1 CoA transferase [Actinomadura syzygii]
MNAPAGSADRQAPGGPLSGIRVLDLGFVYAAPIAAMLLGDYGADVIKIESPAGDPARTHGWTKDGHGLWWKVIGRNKRTATLDLRTPAGQDVLRRFVARADVLVENFRPGVLESWGLGPERLHEINPGLVMLRVSGFGQTGPYAERRAFGTLAEAMSGFAHQTGPADGPPTLPPFGLADGVAGVAGALAVALALYHRQRTGRGQVVDVSLLEPLLGILGPAVSVFDQLGVVPSRNGNRSPNNAPRNLYETRDGRWVAVSASATSIARRVMRLVGHEEVTREPWFDKAGERAARADLLDAVVADWIRERDMADVLTAFTDAEAAIVPIYDVSELVADKHVQERETVTRVPDEDLGPLLMQNVMFRLSETPGGIRSTGRRLGQDNDDVYSGLLGMSADEIERLRLEGVI